MDFTNNPYRRSQLTGQKRGLPSDSMLVTPETRQQQQQGHQQAAATAKRNKLSVTGDQVGGEDSSGRRQEQHERQKPATMADCDRDVNNSFEGSLEHEQHQQKQQNQTTHIERRRLNDAFVSPASSVGPSQCAACRS